MSAETTPVAVGDAGLEPDEWQFARPAKLPFAPPIVGVPVSAASPRSLETFTVLEAGRHRPIAPGLTRENAVALADKLWKPGTVFFIVGTEGSSVTVGSVPKGRYDTEAEAP